MTRTNAYKSKGKVRRRLRTREAALAIKQSVAQRRPIVAGFRPVRVPYFDTLNGKVFDDAGKKKELETYFTGIWSDSGVLAKLSDWIWSRWNPEVLAGFKDISGYLLREVSLDMGKGKAGSHDGVVAEMVAELDELVLDELAEVFHLRVLNHASEDFETAWDIHKVYLILKKAAPKSPMMLRPIAILPFFFLIYSAVLWKLVEDFVESVSKYQFAFKPKHQAADVVFILRMLIEKANEWDKPLYIMDADLPKAFDNVRRDVVVDRLCKRKFPKFFTAS